MMIKLASAILAGAGIALAMAPPAIADENSYIARLQEKHVLPNPPAYKNQDQYMVTIGLGACKELEEGKGYNGAAYWVTNNNSDVTDPDQVDIVVLAAHDHLCNDVQVADEIR
jgi:hypothetical protein